LRAVFGILPNTSESGKDAASNTLEAFAPKSLRINSAKHLFGSARILRAAFGILPKYIRKRQGCRLEHAGSIRSQIAANHLFGSARILRAAFGILPNTSESGKDAA
jgi:hypothetical protein